MKQLKRRKLTLKAAKALAILEIGTAAGLRPCEDNNEEYQTYTIELGNHNLIVSNNCHHEGVAYVSFDGEHTYYEIESLKRDEYITENERIRAQDEKIRDLVSLQSKRIFKELLRQYGLEKCREMLEVYAKK